MKKKVLLTSMMSIAMLASIASGATYALFTAEDSTNIAVTAGKVAVDAYVDENSLKTYSRGVLQTVGTFENGGFAKFDENSNLKLDLLTPGDKANFIVKVDNNSNVNIKYQITLAMEGELAPALVSKVTIDGKEYSLIDGKTGYIDLAAGKDIPDVTIDIELPVEAGNKYQEKSANITVNVEALQGNAQIVDKWDGTSDISWFLANPEAEKFELNSAEALVGLGSLVEGTAAIPADSGIDNIALKIKDKEFVLTTDIDMEAYDENGNRINFDPIGYGYDVYFEGTFDGQGNTIKNLYENGWELGLSYSTAGGGLFASAQNSTFKNITLDNAQIVMECIDMGALVGYSYGDCTYENITLTNSSIQNYNRYTGGLVGEIGSCAGEVNTHTFKDISIDESNTVSALWGTYDAAVGGVIGGKWGDAKVMFENVHVAAVLDVYNDVCSNYQYYNYRLSGMFIGNTEESTDGVATASYVTAVNCSATFGEWAKYTYCEFESSGKPSYASEGQWKFKRVQPGLSYDGVAAEHTHDTDESHKTELIFDQIFGGDKGVRGGITHEGIEIIRNY